MKLYTRFPAFLLLLISFSLQAQIRVGDDLSDIDYARPRQYIIGGVTITGVQYLDHDVLIMLSGLQVADKIEIPGEKIRRAIEKLWEQGLFENVRISATKFSGELVFLNIELQERPRLERFSFKGIKKSEADDLREKIKLVKGDVVTENVINRTTNIIKKHYTGKGFLNAQVNITQSRDTIRPNQVSLIINIDKKNKVRIDAIHFYGNKEISDMTLKRTLKDTKERGIFKPFRALDQLIFKVPVKVLSFNPDTIFNALTSVGTNNFRIRIFKGSKFIRDDYNADLRKLISKYNDEGYRDATIVKDTVYLLI